MWGGRVSGGVWAAHCRSVLESIRFKAHLHSLALKSAPLCWQPTSHPPLKDIKEQDPGAQSTSRIWFSWTVKKCKGLGQTEDNGFQDRASHLSSRKVLVGSTPVASQHPHWGSNTEKLQITNLPCLKSRCLSPGVLLFCLLWKTSVPFLMSPLNRRRVSHQKVAAFPQVEG